MVILLAGGIGVAIGWIFYLFAREMEKEGMRLKRLYQDGGRENLPLLLQWNRPLISFFQRWFRNSNQGRLSSLLVGAGCDPLLQANEIWIWSFLLTGESALFLSLLFGLSVFSVLAGALLGSLYPFFWLFWKRKERHQKLRRDLPFWVDLLAISVMAGIDLMQALQKLVRIMPPGDLSKELEGMFGQMRLGATKKESLLYLKKRMPLPEVRHFVSILLQTMELGVPLGPALLAQADQMREARFNRAEKLGIQASQKILMPLIFCMMPSVFLTVFGPLLLRFLQGGLESFL